MSTWLLGKKHPRFLLSTLACLLAWGGPCSRLQFTQAGTKGFRQHASKAGCGVRHAMSGLGRRFSTRTQETPTLPPPPFPPTCCTYSPRLRAWAGDSLTGTDQKIYLETVFNSLSLVSSLGKDSKHRRKVHYTVQDISWYLHIGFCHW